ncbi:hypothetical protein Pla52o_49910 [Novipirellula galeiformis]|uniref:Uncharacterized protein n=1 Tax=Novipirellula galeiformis TaxID=2528004 RepID=A0A5C6C2Q3_9BACT|nr:hypothetical protein Pla52o_49910 [Novipirellula galeiformis]
MDIGNLARCRESGGSGTNVNSFNHRDHSCDKQAGGENRGETKTHYVPDD